MKKLSKILIAIMIMIISCVALVGCNNQNNGTEGGSEGSGSGTPSTNPTTPTVTKTEIKVAVPDGAPALSIATIVKDGLTLDDKHTLKLDITQPGNVVKAVQTKKLDMAILPTNVATKLYTASTTKGDNDPYVMVATASYGNLFIIGKSTKATFEQMKGKIIYSIGKDAIPGKVLEKVLSARVGDFKVITKEAEVDPNKVNILYVQDTPQFSAAMVAIQSMTKSTTECFAMIADPVVTLQLAADTNKKLCYDLQDEYKAVTSADEKGYPQAVVIAKKSFIAANKAIVTDFVSKMEANITYINNVDNQKAGIENILKNNAYGSKSGIKKFPPKSIAGCNIKVIKAPTAKASVSALLTNLGLPAVADEFFYDLAQ